MFSYTSSIQPKYKPNFFLNMKQLTFVFKFIKSYIIDCKTIDIIDCKRNKYLTNFLIILFDLKVLASFCQPKLLQFYISKFKQICSVQVTGTYIFTYST